MGDSFDPYRVWLGIPPQEQPPSHYRLLGVGLFEDDPEVIASAADRQMAHVRTFQSGPRAALSQRILNELSAAKVCLLDPAKRAAYDQSLREQHSPAAIPPPPPDVPSTQVDAPTGPPSAPTPAALRGGLTVPGVVAPVEVGRQVHGSTGVPVGQPVQPPAPPSVPEPPPVSAPEPATSVSGAVHGAPRSTLRTTARSARSARRKKRSSPATLLAAFLGGGVLVAMLIIALVGRPATEEGRRSRQTPPGGKSAATQDETPSPAKSHSGGPRSTPPPSTKTRVDPPTKNSPSNTKQPPDPAPKSPPVVSKSQQVAFRLNSLKTALRQREMNRAGQLLTEIKNLEPGGDDLGDLQRLEKIYNYVDVFWNAARDGARRLKQGEQFDAGGDTITVTAKSSQSVTWQRGGKEQKVDLRKFESLDVPVLEALALRKLEPDDPFTGVYLGVFLAVDFQGDPRRSLEIIQKTKVPQLDTAALIADLGRVAEKLDEESAPTGPQTDPAPGDQPVDVTQIDWTTFPTFRAPASAGAPLPPLPEEAVLKVQRDRIRRTYQRALARARTPQEKLELVKQLQADTRDTKLEATYRFELLAKARDLAIDAADANAFAALIDEMRKIYTFDALEMKSVSIGQAYRATSEVERLRAIRIFADAVYRQAETEQRLDVALRLTRQAHSIAVKVKDTQAAEVLDGQAQQLEPRERAQSAARAAAAELATDSHDPAASLVVGRYLCVYQNDFRRGLPLLAQCADADLKRLAALDLSGPAEAALQVELAAWWFKLAKQAGGSRPNPPLARRSIHWYQRAVKQLTGAEQDKAKQQLDEVQRAIGPTF